MMICLYIAIGFIAQMIDGTLGMAYGVSCRTFLKSFLKIPSSAVSAVVHYAEIPTSFTSMLSHLKLKNINKKMFWQLLIPGVIGGIIGAYFIVLDFVYIEIIIDIYLIIIGIVIIGKSFKFNTQKKNNNSHYLRFLGFIGGFFDASGGGGWGPIVTGSLLTSTNEPKKVIGTVNSSEFFVTLSSSISFMLLVANIKKYLIIVAGLIIGGVIASPLAAKLCVKINPKKLYLIIGALLVILNAYNLLLTVL